MKSKRSGFAVAAAMLLVLTAFSAQSHGFVNVSIGVNIPAYTFSAPPRMGVIPGTYVYSVADINADILFYHGYWFRPYGGRWYRAASHNGPWVHISAARVPRVLVNLPPHHRSISSEYRRMPYAEFHGNWKKWEKERYWDRDERWREGRHRELREARYHGQRQRY
jgi:hypothetical protein